jgi:uncharacterized membrane protein
MSGTRARKSWRNILRRRILNSEEERAVVQAIGDAEKGNRGEVRVHLEARCPVDDPLARAGELFKELGMQRTAEGTGVLLYVAERDRRAAVYAGPGIHGAAEKNFWQDVVNAVAEGFSGREPARGIIRALGMIGSLLRDTVPGEDVSGNELPDEVTRS